MTAPLLSLRDLSLSFGKTIAADHVSFDIAAGETLALAGPSGSGKSTIARLVMRLIEPDKGRIFFQGADFSASRGEDLRQNRRYIQMVFQDSNASFNPRATVFSALCDPLRIYNIVPQPERYEHIKGLIERVGLPRGCIEQSVHALSGGERQRVAIARAIACKPALLVLDEALSAVDASRRLDLISLLLTLQRDENMSYLFIAHDLGLIRSIAHRVAILDHGRIVEEGLADHVISNPKSAAAKLMVSSVPHFPDWKK